MTCAGKGIRRALAAPIWVLMLVPSVTIPVLDSADAAHELAIEGHGHHPATCPAGHDHNLCMQVRANHPVPTVGTVYRQPAEVVWFSTVAAPRPAILQLAPSSHRSRAPPSV